MADAVHLWGLQLACSLAAVVIVAGNKATASDIARGDGGKRRIHRTGVMVRLAELITQPNATTRLRTTVRFNVLGNAKASSSSSSSSVRGHPSEDECVVVEGNVVASR